MSLYPDTDTSPEGDRWSSPSAMRRIAGLPEGPLPAEGDTARCAGSRLAHHPRFATRTGLDRDNVVGVLGEAREVLSALGIVLDVVRRRDGCIVIRSTPTAGTPGRAACELSKALLQGLLEVNGRTHSSVLESRCVQRGADACLYTLLWNPITSIPPSPAGEEPAPPPSQVPVSLHPEDPEVRPDLARLGQVPEGSVFGGFGLEQTTANLGVDGGSESDYGSNSSGHRQVRQPRLPRWLWRHGWILLVTALAGIVGGWFIARHEPVSYVAQATLVVQSGATGFGPGSANEAGTLATTYAAVIPTDEAVLSAAGAILGVAPATVSHSLSVVVETGTSVLLLTYSAPKPTRAIRGATAIAEIVGGPASASVAIPAGSIAIVRLPGTANQPRPLRSYGMPVGAVLGLMLGFMLVLAAERSDPRAHGPSPLHEPVGLERHPELGPLEWSNPPVRASV